MAANNNHFNLTLDTTAPTGTVSVPAYRNAANLTVTIAPNADSAYMKVWVVGPGTATTTVPTTPVWEASGTSKVITLPSQGIYVVHAQLEDTVGNVIDISSAGSTNKTVNYDATAPTVSSVTIADPSPVSGQPAGETNSLSNNYTINFTDGPSGSASGVVLLTISCPDFANTVTENISSGATSWSGTLDFKSGTVEGTKTVSVTATDAAGNVSAAKTGTIYYDPSASNITFMLYSNSARTTAVPASPSYTNVTSPYPSILINASTQADIVKYKIWGNFSGSAASESTATWVDVTKGTNPIAIPQVTYTSGDGVKVINVEVMDDVGNTSTKTYTVNYDKTNPAATISDPTPSAISNVSGHNSSTFKITATDSATAASGVASWSLYCNSTIIDSGTAAISSEKTETITSATSGMVEGSNTFKVVVTDNAGNTYTTGTKTIVLDVTKPTAKISNPQNIWYNTHPTVSLTEISEACSAWAWVDNSTTAGNIPSDAKEVQLPKGTATIADGDISWAGLQQSQTNYLHIKLRDNVYNENFAISAQTISLNYQQFKYDTTAPSTPSCNWASQVYGNTNATLNIPGYASKDSLSGVTSMYIESVDVGGKSSITPATTGWVNAAESIALTLTTGDGLKKVRVKLRDAAGNESAWSTEATCELDTTTPTGSLTLRDPGTTNPKKSPSNVASVDLYATFVDDSITTQGSGYYAVWGNFDGSPSTSSDYTPTSSDWVAFTTGGSTSITLNKNATGGDGTKYFYIKFKDNAGHISDKYSASFILDATAPEVWITEDYTIISKVNEKRRSSATAFFDDYCDEVKVTGYIATSRDGTKEKYVEYMAVAYNDQTEATSHFQPGSDSWITSHIIEGTHVTLSTASAAVFTITIKGAAYEKALNGGTVPSAHAKDGAHIVVVYVKDEAGTWSGKAIFS